MGLDVPGPVWTRGKRVEVSRTLSRTRSGIERKIGDQMDNPNKRGTVAWHVWHWEHNLRRGGLTVEEAMAGARRMAATGVSLRELIARRDPRP